MTKKIIDFVMLALLVDFAVIFFGLWQLAVEGGSGAWHPFWRVQAEFIINLIS